MLQLLRCYILRNIKQGFKRRNFLNRNRSEITTQPKNNNLNYLINPTFRNINRLFVLSFKNGNNDLRNPPPSFFNWISWSFVSTFSCFNSTTSKFFSS